MSANPRTAYARGAAFEREVKRVFEVHGFVVTRSPKSGGVYDLHATGRYQGREVVLLIQCKKWGFCPPYEWNALYLTATENGAVPLIAARKPREKLFLWRLVGFKVPGTFRQPWERWELVGVFLKNTRGETDGENR